MRLTGLEVRKALRKLRNNNAREFADGTYHAIIHPDTETDLLADPNVQSILQFVVPRGDNHPLIKGSVPQIYGVSFFRTANAKVYASLALSGADSYGTLVFGEDSYIVSKFSLQNVRSIIKPPGTGGPIDALDQYGSIGWKASATAGVLNTNAILRIESTASYSANYGG
ncbi:MAG: hypothetical protein NVSMB70_13650 [Chamaesiphon sp.]